MERETRFELATNSLEGCDSTPELLPLGICQRAEAASRGSAESSEVRRGAELPVSS